MHYNFRGLGLLQRHYCIYKAYVPFSKGPWGEIKDRLVLATFIKLFFYYLIYIRSLLCAREISIYSSGEPRLSFFF